MATRSGRSIRDRDLAGDGAGMASPTSPTGWSTARACWGWRAPPTCATCSTRGGRATRRCSPSTSTSIACAASIAAMAASLGGLDALVFTGGVGERSAPVRALAAEGLGFLGVALDDGANEAATGAADAEVGAVGATVRVFVVPAREDIEIARGSREGGHLGRGAFAGILWRVGAPRRATSTEQGAWSSTFGPPSSRTSRVGPCGRACRRRPSRSALRRARRSHPLGSPSRRSGSASTPASLSRCAVVSDSWATRRASSTDSP